MSRTRIVNGKYKKITHKDYNLFSEGNTNINALGKNQFKADNKTVYDSKVKTAPEYQPDDSVNLYIGMFFDGTGNNRFNSDRIYYPNLQKGNGQIKGEDIPSDFSFTKSVIEKDQNKNVTVKITDRDSYWNPYSNVAKLFDLYKEIKEQNHRDIKNPEFGEHLILKQYIEGIGTKRDEADDFLGSGMARGSWGIIRRVEEGIDKLVTNQMVNVPKNKKINKIVFDVFGFSRGAAAARHFCNEVKKKVKYSKAIRDEMEIKRGKPAIKYVSKHAGGRLGKELSKAGYKSVGDTYRIEIRFLGVFDTVVSDMIIKENMGYKLALGNYMIPVLALAPLAQEALPGIKTKISGLNIGYTFHIRAQTEWRKNFAFTPTEEGYTLGMLGAHSDIGGGYAELDKYESTLAFFDVPHGDTNTLSKMEIYKDYYIKSFISKNTSEKKEIEFANTYDHYIEMSATPLIDKYFPIYTTSEVHKDPEYRIPEAVIYDPTKKHVLAEKKISDHYILKDSRYISNKYSLVPMQLMLEKAIKHNVPFYENYNDAPDVKRKFEYEIPSTSEYEVLNNYLNLMREVSESENKDKDNTYSIPTEIYSEICNKFVHLSAHFGGMKNDFINVKAGDHHFLEKFVFINQPVAPTISNENVNYVREIFKNH